MLVESAGVPCEVTVLSFILSGRDNSSGVVDRRQKQFKQGSEKLTRPTQHGFLVSEISFYYTPLSTLTKASCDPLA
eukprot:scaffold8747_cov96-Cylindrotheca_fusiformis.AAC.7